MGALNEDFIGWFSGGTIIILCLRLLKIPIYINSVLAGGEPEELFGPLRIILHDSLSEKFIVTNLFRETSS